MKGVIGIGNILKRDDGIGIRLVKELENRSLPSDIRIIDADTGGLKVLHALKDFDKVIVIDAVKLGREPGEFSFFSPEEVRSLAETKSSHEIDLLEILELSKQLGRTPEEIVIMGIEPGDTSFGEDLSPELEERFSELSDRLYEKIEEL
ncbi:hypothetical protein AKJ62_04000 [candidate division MSBL1 archaeon SCGC-AAA259D14]|uniref:Hydrogenase maturation protease n=3 Tax=candidate division MSBL1 TaxID=215777 RepID=A0A133UUB3_9EURY|nr:hypothetical protein AKJ62_04000 [candidate division MSBL1 archaeon SCGC-AAA259D14]KXA97716.1 hypothetical protein AKJ38_00445 [candidate division MSBL1 archaeon SCGC-AAA259I14]KXA98938.1 hypothetical protein AKJ39_00070 [candidate division MSBL1 archaeon SCGC-AAA259J03]